MSIARARTTLGKLSCVVQDRRDSFNYVESDMKLK